MSNLDIPGRPSDNSVLWDHLNRLRRLEATPVRGHYQIKVFADANGAGGNLPDSVRVVSTGDGKFIFAIPDDLDLAKLTDCFIYVTVAGSSVIRVQLRYVAPGANPDITGVDMLSTRMEITTGNYTSYAAGTTQRVINPSNRIVRKGGMICIDVDDAGGGVAEGLGVGIELAPPTLGSSSL